MAACASLINCWADGAEGVLPPQPSSSKARASAPQSVYMERAGEKRFLCIDCLQTGLGSIDGASMRVPLRCILLYHASRRVQVTFPGEATEARSCLRAGARPHGAVGNGARGRHTRVGRACRARRLSNPCPGTL